MFQFLILHEPLFLKIFIEILSIYYGLIWFIFACIIPIKKHLFIYKKRKRQIDIFFNIYFLIRKLQKKIIWVKLKEFIKIESLVFQIYHNFEIVCHLQISFESSVLLRMACEIDVNVKFAK